MSEPACRVIVLAPYFLPAVRAGGPVRTLDALVAAAPRGVGIDIVTRATDNGAPLPKPVPTDLWTARGRHRVQYVNSPWSVIRVVVSHEADLVYLNSFFDPAYAILPQVALALMRRACPVLLAPRGELSPGALAHKATKKRLMITVYRALGLHRRVLWHASSEREADEIRRAVGARAGVVVRENETALPDVAQAADARSDGPLRVVFLSRLVPKKGLHVLLEALASFAGRVELDVYGSEEDAGYVRRCRALASASGARVVFHGAVDPNDVRACLALADVMFFPTASENFGHVIAEALSVSCPVVLPDTTPWSDVIANGGGTVIDGTDPATWSAALEEWAELSPEHRFDRRQLAAAAYERWRRPDRPPHVLTLACERWHRDGIGARAPG